MSIFLLGKKRNGDGKGASLPLFGYNRDGAAMGFNNAFCHIKAESGAGNLLADHIVASEKFLEKQKLLGEI